MRRGAGALLLAAVVLALSACTLQVDVNVEVAADGSGAVEVVASVDAEALARVGGDLDAVLALEDLRADGWSVDGPTTAGDGSATVRLRQPFADPEGAEEVFEDLAGAGGPFEGMRVARERSLLETRWRFEGRIDLGGTSPVPSPAGELTNPDGGASAEAETLGQLEERLGASLERVLRVRVGVRLPGDVESNATTRADNGAVWQVGFGDGPIELEATGRQTRTGVVALLVVAGLLVLVGAVALLIRLAMRATTTAAGRGG